jgi:hypothetical protein
VSVVIPCGPLVSWRLAVNLAVRSFYNAERAGSVTGLIQQDRGSRRSLSTRRWSPADGGVRTETAGQFLTVTMAPKRASACYLRSSTELNPSPLHQQFHRHLEDKGRRLAFAQWDVG